MHRRGRKREGGMDECIGGEEREKEVRMSAQKGKKEKRRYG
jgi:hypothetical protein